MFRPVFFLVTFVVIAFAQSSYAVPTLQIYLEGGVYNTDTESWEITPAGSSGGAPFRIWTIGNVGAAGTISDVRLSAAYSEDYLGLKISLTPVEVIEDYMYNAVLIDPAGSTAMTPSLRLVSVLTSGGTVGPSGDGNVFGSDYNVSPSGNIVVLNGESPVLGTGKALPAHGIFGDGVVWEEFGLGDFTATDSQIGDFINEFPSSFPSTGQINIYEVSVTGGSGATIHFDLYDTVASRNHVKAKFAPFSHDADGDSNIAPEPTSCVVWTVLAFAAIAGGARRSRSRAAMAR